MMETSSEKISIITLLFNPFHLWAGAKALIAGLIAMIASGVIAYYSGTRFDGLLDFHFTGGAGTSYSIIYESLIWWAFFSIFLYLCGIILSKSKVRLVDVFGTQALARVPFLLVAILSALPGVAEYAIGLFTSMQNSTAGPQTGNAALFWPVMVISLLATIWAIALMWRAYKVSCNLKGTKAVVSFIAAVLVVEALSKVIALKILS